MRLTLKKWHRKTIAVYLLPDRVRGLPSRAELVKALVSGPFAIYSGRPSAIDDQPTGRRVYTLLHLPSQIAKLTLPRQGLCRQVAEEFGACDLAWESAWPFDITGSKEELAKAKEIYSRWKSYGHRRSWGERR